MSEHKALAACWRCNATSGQMTTKINWQDQSGWNRFFASVGHATQPTRKSQILAKTEDGARSLSPVRCMAVNWMIFLLLSKRFDGG
jgi:hypothetical protein